MDFNVIKKKAYALGFDLCGVTSDFAPTHEAYFLQWLRDKKYAEMQWLAKNTDKRLAPQTLMAETKSVIVVGTSYTHEETLNGDHSVARYAHGEDYHGWMRDKIDALALFLQSESPDCVTRSFVDTGPVLERDLAAKAGLGWVGKNTCLINQDLGSYVFLGVLFTNLDFSNTSPVVDQCLECRLCLDACPTQALKPYQLEPQKCLAYQNIEKRGERDKEFWDGFGDHLVGCDICQEVCPWNLAVTESRQKQWLKSFADFNLGDLKSLLQMTEADYKKRIRNSAVSRIKYTDFMRNVFLVIANTKRHDLRNEVEKWQLRNSHYDLTELRYCLYAL